jgi:Tol biopolymer transport system component
VPEPIYPANSSSRAPDISANGRYVVFSSTANNLVPDDTNQATDIFLYDRDARSIQIISRGEDDFQANGASDLPSISGDGRWITYMSMADNLVTSDSNGMLDVFLYDRETGRTILISAAADGSAANGSSSEPHTSENGAWVVFTSIANNLSLPVDEVSGESGGDTNRASDVFAYERDSGLSYLISRSSTGELGDDSSALPNISADGSQISFWSMADNLEPEEGAGIYVRDRTTGITQWIADGFAPVLSPDGRRVGFVTNSSQLVPDDRLYIAVYDRDIDETSLLGVYGVGVQGGPYNMIDFAAGGEWLALAAPYTVVGGVVPDDSGVWYSQLFIQELSSGTFRLLSTGVDGRPGNGSSDDPSLSADGQWIAFTSSADNLVTFDTNGAADIFVCNRDTGEIQLVSMGIAP